MMLSRVVCAALLVGSFAVANAQPVSDHLKCYKVKDAALKATYTADLEGLAPEPGCLIKVPGKLLCVQTTKTNVSPVPPGGAGTSGAAGRFLCYKLKCPKGTLAPLSWHDQFGTRTLTPSTPKMVCAPEIPSTTTTVTTTSSTTTTLCPVGETLCGSSCVNTQTSPTDCGTCGNACPSAPNSAPTCNAGSCSTTCNGGFGDCDTIAANGCELDTQNDPFNCGACANVCGLTCTPDVASSACFSGNCKVTSCVPGSHDLDFSCANGCECAAGPGGSSCATSMDLGSLAPGAQTSQGSNLPGFGQENWYEISFDAGGFPFVTLQSNPGGQFVIDVFTGCSSAVCSNTTLCTPAATGTYQVRVTRVAGGQTCDSYTLQFKN